MELGVIYCIEWPVNDVNFGLSFNRNLQCRKVLHSYNGDLLRCFRPINNLMDTS